MNGILGFSPLSNFWTMMKNGNTAGPSSPVVQAAPPCLMTPADFLNRLMTLIRKPSQESTQTPQSPEPPESKTPYRHAATVEGQKTPYQESWTWSGDAVGRQRTFQEMIAGTWDMESLREQRVQYEDEIRDLQHALQKEPAGSPRRHRFLAALEAVQYNLVQVSLPLRAQIWVPRNINEITKRAEARQLLSRTDYETTLTEARQLIK